MAANSTVESAVAIRNEEIREQEKPVDREKVIWVLFKLEAHSWFWIVPPDMSSSTSCILCYGQTS